MNSLLVITADQDQQRRLTHFFSLDGYSVSSVNSLTEGDQFLEKQVFDVAVIDVDESNDVGKLRQFLVRNPEIMTIMAHTDDFTAITVSLVNVGAYESIRKPYKLGTLYNKVEKAVHFKRLKLETQNLRGDRDLIYWSGDLIGHSPPFQKVLKNALKVARSDSSIILRGESGTGKEVIAGVIHYNSLRSGNAFVRVNCAALHEGLLETELFGHEKGAFTGAVNSRIGRFEHANDGTIFLDEIADMSLNTQAKVLRVLQEREFERIGSNRTIKVNVRIISATNKDLEKEIVAGRFREDLYYRLNVVTLVLPPLRDRRDDITPLAQHFMEKYSASMNKNISGFDPQSIRILMAHEWPGNIRELKNCIERAVLFSENGRVVPHDLGLNETDIKSLNHNIGNGIILPEDGIELETVERELVCQALDRTDWVQKNAAELLRISPRVLNYKIKRFSITHDKWIVNSEK